MEYLGSIVWSFASAWQKSGTRRYRTHLVSRRANASQLGGGMLLPKLLPKESTMAPRSKAAPAKAGKSGVLKQGNLFSFFSKKPTKDTAVVKPKAATTKTTPSPPEAKAPPQAAPAPVNPAKKVLLQQIKLGGRLLVYWNDDKAWYPAKVLKQREATSTFYYLEYEDGQCEWIDLATESFKLASNKRRIDDDDDDSEAEFEGGEDLQDTDDESAYDDTKAPPDEEDDDDDEGQWMVTDDDDEEVVSGATKPAKKKQKQQQAKGSSSSSKAPKKKANSSLSQFAAGKVTVTEHSTKTPAASRRVSSTTSVRTPQQITPCTKGSPAMRSSTPASAANPKQPPPAFTVGALNPAGSHVHNHLPFLQNPRDAQGRDPSHADYDPRTLSVDSADWFKVTGKKMTDATQQWWDLKSQYNDTVLLFKTGKFYELFHMDADIGVDHLDLSYMKGHLAHAGFPEISYGTMADQLCRAGFKVARVEQTETPEQLKVRKKACGRGKAPKVVNREVCSVLTLGTRTFCFLDDPKSIERDGVSGGSAVGPLLAIREVQAIATDAMDTDEDDVRPACEYGICLIDAVRGSVTLGQFADDVLRSRMTTLLTSFAPSEVRNELWHGFLSFVRALEETHTAVVVSCVDSGPGRRGRCISNALLVDSSHGNHIVA